MTTTGTPAEGPRLGTRWRRAAVATATGLVATAAMATAVYTGAFGLQADLSINNTGFSFASSKIVATDAGFGMTVVKAADGNNRNVLRAGFSGAQMNGLCISKTETVAGIPVTFRLTSGDGNNTSTEIKAADAAFDVLELQARGTGVQLQGSVQIGLSTPDITTTPGAAPFRSNPLGQLNENYVGGFLENYSADLWNGTANSGRMNGQGFIGVDATQATLTTVHGKIMQAQISGNIVLPNLKIHVEPGTTQSCEARAIAAGFSGGYFPGIS